MNHAPTNTPPPARLRLLRRYWAEAVCAAALVLMTTNSLVVITRKCVTTDEAFMIPAGYYHVAERDFQPVFEHPPIVKLLAGLPLVAMRAEAPPLAGAELREYNDPSNLFWTFWRENRARADDLAYWSRVPLVFLAALLGALIFVYTRRLFGERAALFAVLLYTLEPTVLAHGRVVQTDLPAALGLLVFCFAFYDYLRAPNAARAAWVGAAAALAVAMKFSMVVLFPAAAVGLFALLWRARRERPRLKNLAAQGLLLALAAVVTLNAAYLFRHRPPVAENVELVLSTVLPQQESEHEGLRRALTFLYGAAARIIPADLMEGVGWQLNHARGGHDAGLFGRYSSHGWWYYFPVAFALKTTLPFLLLSLAALVFGVWSYARTLASRWLLLLVPFALYTALMLTSTINIGVRYYLPAFPFLFILSGALFDRLLAHARTRGRAARAFALAVVALAFTWMGLETARAFPDYMSYMNQLASGRPHWWYLSDSNLEWGDDVKALAEYLDARGEREVSAAILNYRMLETYGIDYRFAYTPPGDAPATRYVAIGASYLNGSISPGYIDGRELTVEERLALFDDYRRRQPEKIFGGSIYLYRMGD